MKLPEGMVLAWLGLGLLAHVSSYAAVGEPATVSPAATYTADLGYQEAYAARSLQPVGVKLQGSAFQKEPPLTRRGVFRGLLLWGARPEQAMPFIWDKRRGRLYLDLNRNRDLTDDPQGVFASAAGQNGQSFTNIHLALPAAAGERPVTLEATFTGYSGQPVRVYAGLCCYWQGQVSLHGQEWQFGLLERLVEGKVSGLPELVLLRPWAERQRAVQPNEATPDLFDYTTNLFFGGHAYGLECHYVPGGDAAKYRVTFKEQAPLLGELKVTGADLHRLILTARASTTVVLDQPAGAIKLPVGNYALAEIWLRKSGAEAGSFRAGRLVVDAQRPASLFAGGPLTNCVEVRSQRDSLLINYKLMGADGRVYQLPRPDYQHPPELAVFKGTNRLASGKFQYG